jgi:DNA repair photolyase
VRAVSDDFDVRSALLALLAPARPGEPLGDGVTLLDASTEAGLMVLVEARGVRVDVELAPKAAGRRSAASTARWSLGYRTGDKRAPLDGALGQAVVKVVAAHVGRNEEALAARFVAPPSASSTERVRQVKVERLLERQTNLGTSFWSLSPYVGCLVGCRFCYAQSRLAVTRTLLGLPEVPWGSWADARINAAEVLRRELGEKEALPIKFSPIVSDPYHALESKLRLTRACLEVLVDAQYRQPVLMLTREARVVDDAALLARLPRGYAGVSLPTVDEAVLAHFEPRASNAAERLDALKALRAAGLETFAIVQPFLPGDVVQLADALARHVKSARLDVLRGVEGAASQFADARYAHAADPAWQEARRVELGALLEARGVRVWSGELPPD